MFNHSQLPNKPSVNNTELGKSIKSTSRSVASVVFIIISVGGNALVLLAIYRYRRLRTMSNMIIANLSLSDVLFSLLIAPINAFYWSQDDLLPTTVPCHLSGIGALLFGLSSIYTLVFVSIERYLATSYPLKHRYLFTIKAVKYGLAVTWFLSAVLVFLAFFFAKYTYMPRFFHCIANWGESLVFTLIVLFFGNFLPLTVLLYCNTHVWKAIQRRKQITVAPVSWRAKNANDQKEKRVSIIIMAVIGVFILCWTPYSMAMICLAVDGCSFPEEFMSGAVVLTIANGTFNPLIYGVMNRNFRAAFCIILGYPIQQQERTRVQQSFACSNTESML